MEAEKPDRGKFLTIMIVFAAFGFVTGVFKLLTNPTARELGFSFYPEWMPIYTVMGYIVSVPIIIGLWLWKKWAVYLLVLIQLAAIVITFLFMHQGASKFTIIPTLLRIQSIIFLVLWLWAIYRKWKFFNN